MSRFYLLVIFLILALDGLCQQVDFRQFQVDEGLPNNTVFSIFQDRRKFMWIGTKEGICRFDGNQFKTFNMLSDADKGVSEFVYCITEGPANDLWIGTRNGLYVFDQVHERFSLLAESKGKEILSVIADKNGNIWFTANLKIYFYNKQKKKTAFYPLINKEEMSVSSICFDRDHSVLASTLDGYIFKKKLKDGSFKCLNVHSVDKPKGGYVTKIYSSAKGNLLIGSTTGLSEFNPENLSYRYILGEQAGQPPLYVRDILLFSDDVYWVASENGIRIINLRQGTTRTLRHEDSSPYSLSDNAVYTLYKDNEGGIWCGTYFGGINYYHDQFSQFRKYFRRSTGESLTGNAIREICPDGKGNLWIGTEDAGLDRIDPKTGKTKPFLSRDSLSKNIHSLLADRNKLWVGTFEQGLYVIDNQSGKLLHHYKANKKTGLNSNFILTACKLSTGELFFGTSNGVYVYDSLSNRFKVVEGFPPHSYVFDLLEDRNGLIWAGTIGTGLYYFDPKSGKKGNYRFKATDPHSLSSNSVCAIFEDSRGDLWLSTEGGGVCVLNIKSGKFQRYSITSGLPSNMVYQVLEDNKGRMWVTTSQGLAMQTGRGSGWLIYTKADGLITNQFNYSSGYRDDNGLLYFGSVKGLIAFDPAKIERETIVPPIYVTDLEINNQDFRSYKDVFNRTISFTDKLNLKYNQSSIIIGFSGLTYVSSNTRYQYRMDGLDTNWTYTPASHRISFPKLRPGRYIFRLRSVNKVGQAQDNERTLFIHIYNPWWQTLEAYVIYVLAITGLLYIIVIIYHRRQKERHRRKLEKINIAKEKEIYKAKIDFFTNVAHEIRTPLTLIKGPLEMIIDDLEEQSRLKRMLENMEKNTDRLITLTDQLLDFRKTEDHGFHLNFVQANITAIIREYQDLFAFAADQRSLSLKIETDTEDFYAFVDEEAFKKILSNLISNAVKYAKSEIAIKLITERDNYFKIEVTSDGPHIAWEFREKIFQPFFRAFKTGEPGTGIGLSLARALAQLHSGTLELVQTESDHNTFVLKLPVRKAVNSELPVMN